MSEWKAKRFWEKASVEEVADGFTVTLDGRSVKTPAKALMVTPTRAMAEAAAEEWQAQEGAVDPGTMPVTRSINASIDKVAVQTREVVDMLAAYGDADLTCYRAAQPEALVARQTAAWDPLLDWAAERFGARLLPVQGVMHQGQAPDALDKLMFPLTQMSAYELTAMHDLISLSGSLLIGLAVSEGQATPEALWTLSRIDEDWQIEQWGDDDEASALASEKQASFFHAARFLDLSRARAHNLGALRVNAR